MAEEKKEVAYQYTVVHYATGDVDVVPLEVEGKEKISRDAAFNDIVLTAKMVSDEQDYLRARKAAADGVLDALAAANREAAKKAAAPAVDTEVKK